MPPSIDDLINLSDLRIRINKGEPINPREYRDLIDHLRQSREADAKVAKAAGSRARRGAAHNSGAGNAADMQFDLDSVFTTKGE